MTKTELARTLKEKTSDIISSNSNAEEVVSALFAIIEESVANGDEVKIIGFGTFKKKDRPERTGKNPQTGEKIKIAAKSVPVFTAGASFKESVASAKKSKKK